MSVYAHSFAEGGHGLADCLGRKDGADVGSAPFLPKGQILPPLLKGDIRGSSGQNRRVFDVCCGWHCVLPSQLFGFLQRLLSCTGCL